MASDAELIDRSLSGDAEAFMEVIGRHEVAIGAYLERRAGREAAEDLLGDVWAAAYKYRGTYDQSYPEARPWLYTMALNRLRQYWRSRSPEDLVPDVTGPGRRRVGSVARGGRADGHPDGVPGGRGEPQAR